jgi:uncharacterized protein YceH (UPF0502 family)
LNDLLTDVEVRVLGSLIEKEMTTPDYYPLSLNALTNACNQTSNRDPVVHYDEGTVARAIETLRVRSLVRAVQQSGSRVTKYRHLVGETMGLTARYAAVLGVLMLRGPQTVAELRTRASRLADFESLDEVESALHALMERQPSALVTRLPRRPGQKETRYAHLLAGEVTYDVPDAPEESDTHAHASPRGAQSGRLSALEVEVQELRKDLADLRAQLEEFRKQFE